MQRDASQMKQYDDEIDLIGIIEKLIESKKIIILTTLILTTSAYIYTNIKQPIFQSNVLIEIGHYELNNGFTEIIDDPKSIIKDLRINLIYKDLDSVGTEKNVELSILEDKLIEIQYSSNSAEKNVDALNQFVDYLNNKHLILSSNNSQEKRALLTMELDHINSEIENNINFEKLQISSQIQDLEALIPNIDLKISNYKKIISEDEENIRLLKQSPNLYLERTSKNPTLNQVIHNYKLKLADVILMKTTKKNLKANLEEHLNLLESNQFPTEKLFNLSQMKSELETKLKDLENQNFSKTKTIGDIETRELKSNKTKIISLGFILGLITSFLMVFVNTFVEHYRNRKA